MRRRYCGASFRNRSWSAERARGVAGCARRSAAGRSGEDRTRTPPGTGDVQGVKGESSRASSRLLAWYGDDFTGSTDALEALASEGVLSVLFLHQPDDEFYSRFHDYQAFGLGGSSRSETPEWMD